MKNSDVIKLNEVLQKIIKVSKDVKFTYKLIKNKNLIKDIITNLDEVRTVKDEKYEEYDAKRVALCKEYCDKDDNGNPVLFDNVFQGLIGNVVFSEKIKLLNEESAECINNYKKKIKDIEDIFNEDFDNSVEWVEVDINEVPNVVDGEDLEMLIHAGIIK